MKFNVIKTLKNLIVSFGQKTYSVPRNTEIANNVEDLIKNGADITEIETAIDVKSHIKKTFDELSFELDDNGFIYIDGEQLPKCISDRLHNYSECNVIERVKAIILFWKNCQLNPDNTARTDLFKFLEHNNMPITSDGCFIGYKYVTRVGDNLTDSYTKTFNYNIGQKPWMDRSLCNPNRDETCSRGLHVGAKEFVGNDDGDKVVISVKVNPKDVVAIPTDYNQQKLRCCEFESLEILHDKVHKTNIVNEKTQFVNFGSVIDTTMEW